MVDDIAGLYADSNFFLALLNDESGRANAAEALLAEAAIRSIPVATSSLTLTEVAYTVRDRLGGQFGAVERIDALMLDSGLIRFVDLTETIALDGRTLVRAAGASRRRLSPADAVHLASATAIRASVFWTFDKRLGGVAGNLDLPFPVREPGT